MRRRILSIIVCLTVLGSIVSAGSAQEGTPVASGLADLGLPTLDVTVTATGYEGIPDSLEAGRYLVTITAGEDTAETGGGGVAFVQPSGMTGQEFIDLLGQLAGPPDESGVGSSAATPVEGAVPEASPAGGDMSVPPFLFESVMAGGGYASPGQTLEVVLDLPPGEWVAWADDPAAAQVPVAFMVTGEMPADLVEPESTATLTMGEYVIEVTDGEIVTGPQVLRVDNIGAQPHFVFAASTPGGVTDADVEAVLEERSDGHAGGGRLRSGCRLHARLRHWDAIHGDQPVGIRARDAGGTTADDLLLPGPGRWAAARLPRHVQPDRGWRIVGIDRRSGAPRSGVARFRTEPNRTVAPAAISFVARTTARAGYHFPSERHGPRRGGAAGLPCQTGSFWCT